MGYANGPNKHNKQDARAFVRNCMRMGKVPECPQLAELPSPGPPGLELWDTKELVPQVLPADDDLFRSRVMVWWRVRALLSLGLGFSLN